MPVIALSCITVCTAVEVRLLSQMPQLDAPVASQTLSAMTMRPASSGETWDHREAGAGRGRLMDHVARDRHVVVGADTDAGVGDVGDLVVGDDDVGAVDVVGVNAR